MLRYKTHTRPGLFALYDIRPGNGGVYSYNPGYRTGHYFYHNKGESLYFNDWKSNFL